ncbi:MAG TPA: thioredoxin-disulfide reductase [Candidatus Acetothermia bacterium]|nr:thioredoxin-disulfide reductase [Candidatus Acetothermia bacterium]
MNTDLIIIGAGPAGLTAGIYGGRALLSTIILEQGLPGGQLNETDFIENFPGFPEKIAGPELMKRTRSQAERLGAKIIMDTVTRIEPIGDGYRVHGTQKEYGARAVIIASGSHPRELPADGAKELKGKGVSYCATCDGFFFQGKRIIEIGAGDSGLTEAIFLTRFAESVQIVVRHPQDDPHALRASSNILKKRAEENEKISFLWNTVVEKVLGEDRVSGVLQRNLGTGKTEQMAIDGVFVNIGHIPDTEFLRGVVDLDRHGYIVTDDHLRTNLPGVFAAGDVRTDASRYAQAVIAAADGAIAAIEVESYLAQQR